MSSLINTRERAIALEVRGFGAGKKNLADRGNAPQRETVRATILFGICILAAVVWRDCRMSVITVENLRYRYPHARRLFGWTGLFGGKGEFIGIIREKRGRKEHVKARLLWDWCRSFIKGAYGGTVMVDGIEAGRTPVAQLCGHVGLVFQNPFNPTFWREG